MKIIIDKITDKGKLVDPSGDRMIAIKSTITRCNGDCARIRQILGLVRESLSCTHLQVYTFPNSDKYYFILEDGPISDEQAVSMMEDGREWKGMYYLGMAYNEI